MTERPIIFSSETVRAILQDRKMQTRRVIKPQSNLIEKIKCPYGEAGDRLWVRETFYICCGDRIFYKADGESAGDKWCSPLYMPRWVSRITLEIQKVGVERLQDITYQDILDEGWDVKTSKPSTSRTAGEDAKDWFINLWDSLSKKRGYGWDTNPWVWVISFQIRRQEKKEEK